MRDSSEPRFVEVTSIPVVFSDGVGKVVVEGANVRITYIEYRTIGNERVKMPVLEMVRPIAGIKPGAVTEMIRSLLNAPAPEHAH
jgi:hypothetical protein